MTEQEIEPEEVRSISEAALERRADREARRSKVTVVKGIFPPHRSHSEIFLIAESAKLLPRYFL